MKVRVEYYINDDRNEIEYCSSYNRINAKGIKEEVKNMLYRQLGSHAKYAEIIDIYRV